MERARDPCRTIWRLMYEACHRSINCYQLNRLPSASHKLSALNLAKKSNKSHAAMLFWSLQQQHTIRTGFRSLKNTPHLFFRAFECGFCGDTGMLAERILQVLRWSVGQQYILPSECSRVAIGEFQNVTKSCQE